MPRDPIALHPQDPASPPKARHNNRQRIFASLHRLVDLAPRVLPPSHGPIPSDPGAAFATALRRAQRLVDDPAEAVWYGARRIFAFALMIHDGIPAEEVEPYLHARAWLTDAARLLGRTSEALAAELVDAMLRSSATIHRDKRLYAAAEHTPVAAESLRVPFPRAWPVAAPTTLESVEPQ
jgi:hypothetical protein